MSRERVIANAETVHPGAQVPNPRRLGIQSHAWRAVFILVGGVILLMFGMALSISVGAAYISLPHVWSAVFHFNPNLTSDQIVHYLRLPRAIAALMVGICFAGSW